ncbi:MAG: DUF4160 domain-containing protein [Rudanella sp.]|nr:DUF4160 domain-containing protein [Rudanella sp.]
MATLFRLIGLRFFYLSFDLLREPCHLHATDDRGQLCKYWIRADGSFILADSKRFKRKELNKVEKVLTEQMQLIQKQYEDDCTSNNITVNYCQKTD